MRGQQTVEHLGPRLRRIIEALRGGDILCRTFLYKQNGEKETVYTLLRSQRNIGPASAEAALASGLLIPSNDGLFGDGDSQTWRA